MRIFLLALCLVSALASAAPLPGDSLYQLQPALTAQDGKVTTLDRNRGQPTVVSMFYGSCGYVCPMLIASIRRLESQLDQPSRQRLRVMLVSLDPAHDTPERMRELATRHGADLARWTFASTPEPDVRRLAAALGIRYRQLPDGGFNHSTVITLLDGEGRMTRQTSSLTGADPVFLEALRRATADR